MTPRPLSRSIRRAAMGAASRTLAGVALVGVVAGLVALAGRPESWAAGPGFAMATGVALAGTGAVAALLLGALAAGFLLRVELSDSGVLSGLGGLGLGPRAVLVACAPVLLLWTGLVGACSFGVEPLAWTAVHRVKGSPAISAAALGRLEAGEVVAVPGGALVAPDGGLRARVGGLTARAEAWGRDRAGWSFDEVRAEHAGDAWQIDRLRLRPAEPPEPPRSPWTRGWSELRRQIASGDQVDRARFVWHRRHALIVLAPLLGVFGFALGPRRTGSFTGATLRVGGFAVLLFLLVRAADALPAPLLAGWAPVLLAFLGGLALRRAS